jgi:Transglycosylase SLT domain
VTAYGLITQPLTPLQRGRNVPGFVFRLIGLLVAFYAVGLLRPAAAGESDEFRAVVPSAPSNVPDIDALCNALAAAAQENDLPIVFFTRLIWQESRFDPTAVSRAGAQGVAQFMPDTAMRRGLSDPFDPLEAIPKSAKLLRDLRSEFGNLGLAAAAYNAGSGRVHDWLAGRRGLPGETSTYVRIVTGRSPEQWAGGEVDDGDTRLPNTVPCRQTAGLVARAPVLAVKPPPDPWGVELVGGPSDATALLAYRRIQEKYAALLGDREPLIVHHGLGHGSMGWAHVRVGADNRSTAEKLCANLRAAGVIYCEVQRNGTVQSPRLRVRAMSEARPGRAPAQPSD